MEPRELIKRFESVSSDRAVVQDMWDSIEAFVTPYRGRFFKDTRSEGTIEWFKNRNVYDSTAIMAHQNLAANLHGSLTNPSARWFDMRFRQSKLNKNKQASTWLQHASESVYYSLQDSNFNLEINETYQDLAGFGTASILLEEGDGTTGWNGLNFTAVPLKEAYFEEDFQGNVLRFYRKMQWTPQQIISKFGDVPESVSRAEEAGIRDKMDVIFCIYPRNNNIVQVGTKQAPSRRPWAYQYILRDDASKLGKEGGYYEMPAYAPRWRTTSGSQWGNSPAMMAIGDILTLNAARKMQLVASEKLIDPPLLAEERALITDLNLEAAGLTVVRNIDGVRPLETRGQISVSDHMVDQLQEAVRNYFFTNQLQFPPTQAQPMTATEAQIRYDQIQRLLGPTLGRIQNDMLDPIVSRAFRMLARDGQVEPPPQIVIDNNAEFDIEYIGALPRAQRMDKAASMERLVGFVANVSPVLPEALDSVDANAMVRSLALDLNVDAEVIRDESEVEQVQNERKVQQQAMQEAAIAQQQGEAAQAVAGGDQAMMAAQEEA